jgi:DNA-binding transcriptional ArsR family regulator
MDEMIGNVGRGRGEAGEPPRVELEAKLFSGLADPKRLALLRLLVDGPRTAGELARSAQLSPSGASNHLRCLLECGLVAVESDGPFNRYRLADVGVGGLLLGAEQLLSRVGAEIEACLNYGPPSRRALRAAGVQPPTATRPRLAPPQHGVRSRGHRGAAARQEVRR